MKNSPILKRHKKALSNKKAATLFRTLPKAQNGIGIDLSTNSYLNLHANKTVLSNAKKLTGKSHAGNLASRLIKNVSPLYAKLEAEIAAWEKTESALIFGSGYAANVGTISALANRKTSIFSDKLNHASIVDGIKLSGASLFRYKHVDMAHLSELLQKCPNMEKLIVTDSVFSMDGNLAPLKEICRLAKKHNAMVMVDEAHAAGIFGKNQSGLVEHLGVEKDVDIRIGTLSKTIGGYGGYFAGNTILKDVLVNAARSFIYSTGLPHSTLAYNLAAVKHIRKNKGLGKKLLGLASNFKNQLDALGFNTLDSSSQIVPCIVENAQKAMELSALLKKNGIAAPAIRPPTVPAKTSRVRFSVHLGLTKPKSNKILRVLKAWKKNG